MREASRELLVSRILVWNETPRSVLRIELACAYQQAAPEQWPDPQVRPVQRLRADELAQLARRYAVGGLLFAGHRSALGRSGLPGLLPRLRSEYAGWIGLELTGPEPRDLQAVLREPLLDFLDVQLAWRESDPDTVRVDPSLRQVVSLLRATPCPCVIRFIQPADEDRFNELSAAFDAFVRVSQEPVAVQVVDPPEPAAGSSRCAPEAAEFIACRPAWLVRQSQAQWYQVQPEAQNLPQARTRPADPRRRRM